MSKNKENLSKLSEEELSKKNKKELVQAKKIDKENKKSIEQLPPANKDVEEATYFLNDYEKNRNKIYKVEKKENSLFNQKNLTEEELKEKIVKEEKKAAIGEKESIILHKESTPDLKKKRKGLVVDYTFLVVFIIIAIFITISLISIRKFSFETSTAGIENVNNSDTAGISFFVGALSIGLAAGNAILSLALGGGLILTFIIIIIVLVIIIKKKS